ncbi:hypothetical protein PVAP13_9NG190073 [Panicum virgatum]|uniref:Uncharacterized protein n=1 Tax=Panicum virgatum TaxID=38727 RepID=A0A8T0MJE8_PANVG|nr:hypothetical protein PVAP13_9NG190073 [Panicum virgatum]
MDGAWFRHFSGCSWYWWDPRCSPPATRIWRSVRPRKWQAGSCEPTPSFNLALAFRPAGHGTPWTSSAHRLAQRQRRWQCGTHSAIGATCSSPARWS